MEIKDCFIIMPFSKTKSHSEEEWTELYEEFFKPAWNEFNILCHRAEVSRGSITKDIIEKLFSASMVFADITDFNPNVMYELGVRHSFKKPSSIVIESRKSRDIPFDVRDYNIFKYTYSVPGLRKLKNHINEVIRDIEQYPNKSDNPVWDFLSAGGFIIDYCRKTEDIQRLRALKEELEFNLDRCSDFVNKISSIKISKNFQDWTRNKPSEEDEQELQMRMEEFYPVIRNDALTHLKITRYVSFPQEDWYVLDDIDKFFRWCNCFSNNLAAASFYECEKQRIDEIREIIQKCILIIDRRISELEAD